VNCILGLGQEGRVIMERKLAILIIYILLIGLAGGFIVSFVVYQPQIQSLRNDLASLEDKIDSNFTENEETLSELNEAISNLNSAIEKLNSTSETIPENETKTTFESLEVQEAQATTNGTHFEVNFRIKNSGTESAALILIYLGLDPIQYIPDVTLIVVNGTAFSREVFFTLPIPVGASLEGNITLVEGLDEGLNLQSNSSIELKFISAKRYEYSVAVNLP
jgi:hypothetical protein